MRSCTTRATRASRSSSSSTVSSPTDAAGRLARSLCRTPPTSAPSSSAMAGWRTGDSALPFVSGRRFERGAEKGHRTRGANGPAGHEGLSAEVQADQRVGAVAGVEKTVGQGRVGANHALQDRRVRERLESARRGSRQDQLAVLAKDEQPVARKRDRASLELLRAPLDRSGPQLHRAKGLAEFLAPVKSVQVAVVVDARRVVI